MADATTTEAPPAEFSFETIKPEEGDVILMKLPPDPSSVAVNRVAQALTTVFPGHHIFLLPHGTELETVDEERMRAAGWMPIA